MLLKQAERTVAVASPLGEDVLLFRAMTATERLGRLFQFDLELLSEDHYIKLEDVLGQNVTVRLNLPQDGGTRFFNGYVSQFSYAGWSGDLARYRAQLRPWLWFLTRRADSRIFQEMTVPDIIKQIFGEHGGVFEDKLSASYRTWTYCVQYRETDFNFVSRLMEQEGIYYYFLHEDGKHTMVLADDASSHDRVPGYEQVPYYPPVEGGHRERDHISEWSLGQEVKPGAYTLRDFDYKKPKKDLEVRLKKPFEHAQAEGEVYDYPGEYKTRNDGDAYARIRLEELHCQHERAKGKGDVAGLAAGSLFELTEYPREDQNREYLVVSSTVELRSDAYVSEAAAKGETLCQCRFAAIDSKRPFRAQRVTPEPIVQGPQTAIVTGPSGEEIWTDEHGRVKVQFHWDREGQYDEKSSCWIRVSHPWAGKKWGAVAIPRIGQEVIVDFLEGDPDRPIITGRVYNGDYKSPYGLPDGAVISGLKSNSTKGGGGYNEISMDDTKGSEKITIHGQYDMSTTVEHDQTLTVHNNRTSVVDVDDTETITNNQSLAVGVDQKLDVGSNQTVSVGSNQDVSVGSNQNVSVGSARKLAIGSTDTVSVGANRSVDVGANLSMSSGANTKISAGANIDVSAGGVITLSTGGSSIEITPGGINISSSGPVTITGAVVKVNS